jgi:hypothetical protein
MKALKAIFAEAIGLFVDDGAYAAAIVIWLLVVAGLVRFTTISPNIAATLLFVGLAAILTESSLRQSRK